MKIAQTFDYTIDGKTATISAFINSQGTVDVDEVTQVLDSTGEELALSDCELEELEARLQFVVECECEDGQWDEVIADRYDDERVAQDEQQTRRFMQ